MADDEAQTLRREITLLERAIAITSEILASDMLSAEEDAAIHAEIATLERIIADLNRRLDDPARSC